MPSSSPEIPQRHREPPRRGQPSAAHLFLVHFVFWLRLVILLLIALTVFSDKP
jgi:hypothetical protein